MKQKILFIFFICMALVFASCTTNSSSDKTIQEEAADVVKASQDSSSADTIRDEVDDVIAKLPSTDAKSADSSFQGYGMTYLVDGERFTHDDAQVLSATPVAGFLTITAPDSTGTQLRMLPNEVGTYIIGEGPNQWRLVDVWFAHNGRHIANNEQGSGTITITEVGVMNWPYEGDIAGTFEGTFVAPDGSSVTVSDGEFRAKAGN